MSGRTDNVPDWIESKLFENALHETLGDFSKILNFKAFQALAPGENYATVMIRVEIEVLLKNGGTHKQNFMLKVPHDTELYHKELTKWDMFTTESNMYQKIVPELEKLYADIGLKVQFGANSYKLPIEKEYILLEDLSQKGFKNAPRQDCLDLVHCEAVLKKLAQWHAASAVRVERNGLYEDKYCKGMFIESGKEVFKTMLESDLKHLINTAKKLPNAKEYLQQLESLKENITDLFYKQSIVDDKEFNILNHGDCWSNNIMFKYDKAGKLQETYLVDLQVPTYGSPAQDLLYFIFSSAQCEIKVKKFDYMIKYYYDNLIKYLKLLSYGRPLPKLKQLQMSLIRHGQWAFFAAILTMAAVLCDPTDKASADNFVGDCQEADKFKEMMYSNERYMKHMEEILPWLSYRGVLEH